MCMKWLRNNKEVRLKKNNSLNVLKYALLDLK